MSTCAELAALLGCQRETVTRTLNRLVDLRMVAKQRRNLVIRDFDASRECAEAAEGWPK
jgi:CRP-like cAMP-binding protein